MQFCGRLTWLPDLELLWMLLGLQRTWVWGSACGHVLIDASLLSLSLLLRLMSRVLLSQGLLLGRLAMLLANQGWLLLLLYPWR